jgi:hypothetical protein
MNVKHVITTGLTSVAFIVACVKQPDDFARNNLYDPGGLNWHGPVVTVMNDTTIPPDDSITITATATDNDTVVAYVWAKNGTTYSDTTDSGFLKVAWSSSGRKVVRVKAIDNDGISSEPDSCVVYVTSCLLDCGSFTSYQSTILCLPFNGDAKDQSGNGHDGELLGPTLTQDRFGNADEAYFFDGINDYMLFDTVDLELPVTVSLWYKTTTTNQAWNSILSWNNQENNPYFEGIQIFTNGYGRLTIRIGTNYDDYTLSPIIVGDSLWHHIIVFKDINDSAKVYVDDTLLMARTISSSIGNRHLLILGRSHQLQYTSEFFQGCIDDVTICH